MTMIDREQHYDYFRTDQKAAVLALLNSAKNLRDVCTYGVWREMVCSACIVPVARTTDLTQVIHCYPQPFVFLFL